MALDWKTATPYAPTKGAQKAVAAEKPKPDWRKVTPYRGELDAIRADDARRNAIDPADPEAGVPLSQRGRPRLNEPLPAPPVDRPGMFAGAAKSAEKLWHNLHVDPAGTIVRGVESALQAPAQALSDTAGAYTIAADKLTGSQAGSQGVWGDVARNYAQPVPTTPEAILGRGVGTTAVQVGAPALGGLGRAGTIATGMGIGGIEQGVANWHAAGGKEGGDAAFNSFLSGLGVGAAGAALPLERVNRLTKGELGHALADVAVFGSAGAGQTAVNSLLMEHLTGRDLEVLRDAVDAGFFGALTGAIASGVAHVAMARTPKEPSLASDADKGTAPKVEQEITDKAPEAPTSEFKLTEEISDDRQVLQEGVGDETGGASKPAPKGEPLPAPERGGEEAQEAGGGEVLADVGSIETAVGTGEDQAFAEASKAIKLKKELRALDDATDALHEHGQAFVEAQKQRKSGEITDADYQAVKSRYEEAERAHDAATEAFVKENPTYLSEGAEAFEKSLDKIIASLPPRSEAAPSTLALEGKKPQDAPAPAVGNLPDVAVAPGSEAVAPTRGAASDLPAPEPVAKGAGSDLVQVDFKSIDAERAKMGLPESTHGERRAWEKANQEAESRDPRRLLSELERNPRPLTDTDVATILREKNRLRLERNAIEKQIKDDGDSPELQARAQEVADELFKLGETIGPAKTKSGQGLAALKMAMKEDYSLGEIERTLRVANKGESSAEVKAKAKELHDRLDVYVKEFDEYQAKVETRLREVETKALKREVRRRQREPGKVEEFLTKKADEARARLKSAGIARDVGSVLEDVAIIGAEKVVKGTIEFAEWSKAMIDDLGDKVKPHLEAAFERAKALAHESVGDSPRERDLIRQIRALEKQIKTGELKPTGAKQGPDTENVANLKIRRDALADRVKKMRETPAEANSATQREVRALDKRIARLDERIKAGDTSSLNKPKQGPKPAEIVEMQTRRAELRTELARMRRDARRAERGDPRLRAAKTRMKNLADKLFERITYEDFAKRDKRPPVELDEEGIEIKTRLDRAKREIPIAARAFERRHWTEGRRQLDNAKQILGATTDVLTSMDLPPILRQGGWLFATHPILSSKAFVKSFPAMGGEFAKAAEAAKAGEWKEAWKYAMSDDGARKIQTAIESNPNYEKLKAGGTEFTGYGESLTHQEENVRSRISQNIPITAQTQRGFVAFMNLQRLIVGTHLLNRAQNGTKAEQAKSVGRYINDATGRGHFTNKKLDASLELARLGLFAPRLYLSRLNLLTGRAWREATPEVRRIIEQDYAVMAATLGAIGGFAALMGNEDAFDWRSSDFLKVRVGDTRLDLTPQIAQYATLLGRMTTGETKSDAGVKPAEIKDVVASFAENKLTPPLSAAIEMKKSLEGKKGRSGEVETPMSVIGNLITPMSPRQVVQTIRAQGFPLGAAMSLAGMLGAGLNTYKTKQKAGYYR